MPIPRAIKVRLRDRKKSARMWQKVLHTPVSPTVTSTPRGSRAFFQPRRAQTAAAPAQGQAMSISFVLGRA